MSAPRANTYMLAQFLGDHADLKEAVTHHIAQTRAMGGEINLKHIYDRLESLCRRELQQVQEDSPAQQYWRAQYGYVRRVLHQMASGIRQTNPRSAYQVGEQVVVTR